MTSPVPRKPATTLARRRPGRAQLASAGLRNAKFVDTAVQSPYNSGMATKTRRWETRVDEETDTLTADAAARKGVTKSAFVAAAVRAEAERTLARADTTLMDESLFSALVGSLDLPDSVPALERLTSTPKPYRHG